MKRVNKTLATLALGLSLATPAFGQYSNSGIRKVAVQYRESAVPTKSDNLYGVKFNASTPENGELQNSIEGRGLNIYYQSGKDNLTTGDLEDLAQYSSIVGNSFDNIKIEASADKQGDAEYNQYLSLRRAESVKSQLSKIYPRANIEILALGERPGENLAERRKVKVTIDNPISENINNSSADYFLVDMSSSMYQELNGSKISRSAAVKQSTFREGSEFYVFSGTVADSLKNIEPEGGTPLYNSMYDLIKIAKDSTEIEVLTDGVNSDNIRSRKVNEVVSAAKKKGIKLSITSVGIPVDKKKLYSNMSESTGGKYKSIR